MEKKRIYFFILSALAIGVIVFVITNSRGRSRPAPQVPVKKQAVPPMGPQKKQRPIPVTQEAPLENGPLLN